MKFSDKSKKLLFVGGDLRQIYAINKIARMGNSVFVLAFDTEYMEKLADGVQLLYDTSEIEEVYDAVVLPLPYSTDGKVINTPLWRQKLMVSEVFSNVSGKNKILAGRCDTKIKAMAESHRVMLVDYLCREELAMLNAIPTAEGAIQIAMSETPYTLHGSRCLIAGGGRIARILAKMLAGIGARVTFAARKKGDLAYAFAMGYDTCDIHTLSDSVGDFDVIFNTVPSLVFDYDLLSKMKKNVIVIDLASKPGGVDFDEARRQGIKVIWALSLPGKVAPDTAGDIICSTILNIVEEMEGNE